MKVAVDCSNGVALSLEPANRVQEVLQSIFIVLNTMQGEVPCYRNFGINGAYLHKPILTAQTMYAAAVSEAIERFVPGVTVEGVSFKNDAASPETLAPILEVTIDE